MKLKELNLKEKESTDFSGDLEVHVVFQKLTQDRFGNPEQICVVKDIDWQEGDPMGKLVLKKDQLKTLTEGDKIKVINYKAEHGIWNATTGTLFQPWIKKLNNSELIKQLS